MSATYEERLMRRVDRATTDCWLWLGSVNAQGYGYIQVPDVSRPKGWRTRSAHRLSHEVFLGPIPEGYEVDHLCHVRNCIRPTHLEAVTSQVNSQRRSAHLRLNFTACRRGHPVSPENTAITPAGTYRCRVCHRNRGRAIARGEYVTTRRAYNTPDYDTRTVRQWAQANGVPCPPRGRFLPPDVVTEWLTAERLLHGLFDALSKPDEVAS